MMVAALMVMGFLNSIALAQVTDPASQPSVPTLDLEAVYTVPVDQDSMGISRFSVDAYRIAPDASGRATMNFDLPLDLSAGEVFPVSLALVRQEGASKYFEGPNGSASCVGRWVELQCSIRFANIRTNSRALGAYLEAKYGDGPEAQARKTLADQFLGDPIGTVQVNESFFCQSCRKQLGIWSALAEIPGEGLRRVRLEIGVQGIRFFSKNGRVRGSISGLTWKDGQVQGMWDDAEVTFQWEESRPEELRGSLKPSGSSRSLRWWARR